MQVKITEECILDRPFRREIRTLSHGEEDCQKPPLHLETPTRRSHRRVKEKKEGHEHPLISLGILPTRTVAFVVLGEATVECAVD